MSRRMYKLIMFDLDGTLLDSFDSIADTFNDTFVHFGMGKATDEEMVMMIGPRVYDTFRIRFGKSHDEATEMTEWFRRNYAEEHLFKASVYPGIIDLLKELRPKGPKTAIVTNKRYDYTQSLADHFGLTPYFDGIYGTDFDNTVQKHQLIEGCLEEFHMRNTDAVMVGDTDFDRNAAERCGVDFIPVSYGFGKWDVKSCGNANELAKILLDGGNPL